MSIPPLCLEDSSSNILINEPNMCVSTYKLYHLLCSLCHRGTGISQDLLFCLTLQGCYDIFYDVIKLLNFEQEHAAWLLL